MIRGLTLLFVCQLAGEIVVRALGSPFPGPVLGMGLLFAGLLIRGHAGAELEPVADTILRNLSLLFVPAAVGIVQQVDLIAEHWGAIFTSLILSTLLTLIVTVATFRLVVRALARRSAA
jgi:holin-like protein